MKALLIIVASITLLACSKNKNTNSLIGSWKLTETFRIGQPWTPVSPAEEMTLTFKKDNTYSLLPPPVSSFSGCTGTYRITNSNTVMMTTSCPRPNPGFEEEYGFTRDGNMLIIDHRTTSSGVKSKYVKL